MLEELSPEAIASLVASLPSMPLAEKESLLNELETLEHKKALKKCREDFLAFCAYIYPQWKEGPHHRYMKPLLHKVRLGEETRLTVSMPPRFGKQLDHDTPILTQNRGWVRHGDLVIGDKVFHPSGLSTDVVGLSDEQTQDCEVETFDGAVIRCHENHEWTVYDRANAKWRTVETKFFEKQKILSGERARFQLPLVHALQFPDADLPLDPYFLGAWLGDGRSSATDICGAEDDLVRIVERIPHEKGSRWVHKDTGVVHQNFVGVVKALRTIGVLNNKHIPTLYMHASERQRRELLAGLVDTDGTQDKTGRIHFDGLSERLVRNVAELARSFGYRVGVIQVPQDMREREIKATAPTWRCYWTPHDGQGGGTLPRKKAHRVRDRRQIGIKEVRRVAPSKGRCIQVASGDGLYLAGTHLTPTHNSETIAYLFVAWYLGHLPNHHIMMATHTAALSADFGRKVRNLLDTDKYKEIFPNTAVSKDKSAADNWTTTAGGKYLAIGIGANVAGHGAHLLVIDDLCIYKNSIVHTLHGDVPAHKVVVGDYLLGEAGWQQVLRKTTSEHATSVCIDGLRMSNEHPVWTFNAGWQRASAVNLGDMLRTTVFWCKIKSSILRGLKNVTTSETVRSIQARVQHLGNDETAVQQPQGRQLHQLWRGGDQGVSRVRDVFGVFANSWPGAINQTHAGSQRQRAGVHSAELPLGRRGDAAEQPNERGSFCVPGEDAVITAVGEDCRHTDSANGAPTKGAQDAGRRRDCVAEAELGAAPRKTDDFGWGVGAAVRLFGFSSSLRRAAELAENNQALGRGSNKLKTVGLRWIQGVVVLGVEGIAAGLGVLVGVRRVSRVEQIDIPGQFVNFEVRGDNTFFAQGILTHNCSEQAILANPDAAFATAWEYIQVGPLQRLMPGGRIVMIGTRWGRKDPIGRALAWAENNPNSTPWNEVRFPAILPQSGKSLWPEQWPLDQLLAKKAGMQPQFWAAQYMQEPTSEEGAILKREWWQIWEKDDPPDVEFVMQVWDTAHDTKSHNDFSACITWGVFFNETTNRHELIMLNAIKGRWEFPQLKQKALDEYKEWQPECLLIEKKAAGAPLIQELRQMDMIIEEYSPSRAGAGVSNDKRARVNSVAPLLFDKVVWAPDHRWAFEVINECAEFPHGENDDFVDCVSMSLARYRRGGFVSLSSDRKDEPQLFRRRSAAYY